MKIAYLTTAYPSVSHTFIRREILGLEDLGQDIKRIALRPGEGLVDESDVRELRRTEYILDQPWHNLLLEMLKGLILARGGLFRALWWVMRLSARSDRGLVRHLAYLVEALSLRAKLSRSEVTHLHVHFGTNISAVALLARLMNGPAFSMTVHGPDEFDAPIGFSLDWKIKHASFVVAISSYGSAQLMRWASVSDWDKIKIVRCSVGEEWFDAAPVSETSQTLVCVGRLSAQKGQLLLIDAFSEVLDVVHDQKLILIGDGEMREELEERIRLRGLQDQVEITGWQSAAEIRSSLMDARALVLPSFAEGLPVVIMEAFAMQRPVLSTSIMGIPELVQHEVNGWLVPAGDARALRNGLLKLARTPVSTLREMGVYGQERTRERHSVEVEAHKMLECFARAADKEKVPSSGP